MDKKRAFLTVEEALAMLPDGEDIHTFVNGGLTLIGADWSRDKVVELITTGAVCELAGELATDMGHGLVVWQGKTSPLFVETKKASE